MKGLIYRIKDLVTGKVKLPVTIDEAVQIGETPNTLNDITKNIELGWTKEYSGRKLSFNKNKFNVKTIGNLSPLSSIKQGIAYDGTYLAVVTAYVKASISTGDGTTTIWLYNARTMQRLAIITIPHYFHGNTMAFSKYKPSNSPIPYLFIDEWDEKRGLGVVAINSNYQATLVSYFTPRYVTTGGVFGDGMTDWVVDEDNGFLYSFTYKKSGSTTYQDTDNNGLNVCQFLLPQDYLTQGKEFDDINDVIKSWKRNCIYVRQNCAYKDGLFYILSGATANGSALAQLAPPSINAIPSGS